MDEREFAAIELRCSEGVGWITLNRPRQINAINDEIRHEFPRALAACVADAEVRVIIVCGAGERGFCVGADIKEARPPETSDQVRQRMAQTRWIESLQSVDKPVIAAIHGFCLGGGLELALACDIRMASAEAVFALPELALGLIPGGGGTQRVTRVIGLGRALDLVLSGARLSAEEARAAGLITRISANPETLRADARALADQLAATPVLAVRHARRLLHASLETTLASGLDDELDSFAELAVSDERVEAARAFRAGRRLGSPGK
jgi:enoyl-CoA hydratase